jgi:hypothetical protein
MNKSLSNLSFTQRRDLSKSQSLPKKFCREGHDSLTALGIPGNKRPVMRNASVASLSQFSATAPASFESSTSCISLSKLVGGKGLLSPLIVPDADISKSNDSILTHKNPWELRGKYKPTSPVAVGSPVPNILNQVSHSFIYCLTGFPLSEVSVLIYSVQ